MMHASATDPAPRRLSVEGKKARYRVPNTALHTLTLQGSIYVGYTVNARIHVTEGHLCGSRVCGSLPAAFGRCKHIVPFSPVRLSLGCPLGSSAGVSTLHGRATEGGSGKPGDLMKSCLCAAVCWDGCSDENSGVSPIGCALLAVRACLLVSSLLCRATLSCASTKSFTRYPPYPAYPTVVLGVRHTSSMLSCV
jgi:hypothetical protein